MFSKKRSTKDIAISEPEVELDQDGQPITGIYVSFRTAARFMGVGHVVFTRMFENNQLKGVRAIIVRSARMVNIYDLAKKVFPDVDDYALTKNVLDFLRSKKHRTFMI